MTSNSTRRIGCRRSLALLHPRCSAARSTPRPPAPRSNGPRADAAARLEQLEQLRRGHQRAAHHRNHRRHDCERHARCRLRATSISTTVGSATKARGAIIRSKSIRRSFRAASASLPNYAHERGMKLGIYSGPGQTTCAGYTGSEGHEARRCEDVRELGHRSPQVRQLLLASRSAARPSCRRSSAPCRMR